MGGRGENGRSGRWGERQQWPGAMQGDEWLAVEEEVADSSDWPLVVCARGNGRGIKGRRWRSGLCWLADSLIAGSDNAGLDSGR